MGVRAVSQHYSIDMGYSNFFELRSYIASLANPEIFEHYRAIARLFEDSDYKEYDKETERLFEKHKRKWGWLFDFLYQPDTEGRITIPQAKKLILLLSSSNQTERTGYAGTGKGRVTIDGFVNILKDSVATKKQAKWY